MQINQIVAFDQNGGIGYARNEDGKLPWNLPLEFARYAEKVTNSGGKRSKTAIIMGRKSFDQHLNFPPCEYKRKFFSDSVLRIILSREKSEAVEKTGGFVCGSWNEVENILESHSDEVSVAWNIGGPAVYRMQDVSKTGTEIHVTRIQGDFDCDLFYPHFETIEKDKNWERIWTSEKQLENGVYYHFETYLFKKQ